MSFTPNREELAWAAGFFDGEGSFHLNKRAYSLRASIAQTERTTLERFNAATGNMGTIHIQHPTGLGSKLVYSLIFSNFDATQALAAMLWHHLSGPKKAQYKACLAFARTNPNWGTAKALAARKTWKARTKTITAGLTSKRIAREARIIAEHQAKEKET